MKKDGEFEVYGLYHVYEVEDYDENGDTWVEQQEELLTILLLTEEEKELQQGVLNNIDPIVYINSYAGELHCLKFVIKKIDAKSTCFWAPNSLIPSHMKDTIIGNINKIKITPDWTGEDKEDSENE